MGADEQGRKGRGSVNLGRSSAILGWVAGVTEFPGKQVLIWGFAWGYLFGRTVGIHMCRRKGRKQDWALGGVEL